MSVVTLLSFSLMIFFLSFSLALVTVPRIIIYSLPFLCFEYLRLEVAPFILFFLVEKHNRWNFFSLLLFTNTNGYPSSNKNSCELRKITFFFWKFLWGTFQNSEKVYFARLKAKRDRLLGKMEAAAGDYLWWYPPSAFSEAAHVRSKTVTIAEELDAPIFCSEWSQFYLFAYQTREMTPDFCMSPYSQQAA